MIDATIRRFEPTDGDAVLALNERAMAAEGTDPEDVPGINDLRRIESEYLDSGGEFLVADLDGDVVGMGGLTIGDEVAELFRMRVDPAYQHRGIGSALLDRLEQAARERGATRLLAETARRQQAATEFYPAHGFEERGRRSFGEYELISFEKSL
ncbi:Acetyltransferase (GNAT) family [Halapricum desulfuricans]|uniref:Acetyltransferase (GNAT) family n=1 Tax=Halapricum desulfuricans TaxID=2841257 RepID=A0A897NJV6_9EURY|nr:GNAT family N-acetyltransferase [Halapricum desulfuricans]QSG13027.1 Acetyltransferase (GNAT) family [Halapricum desulfuricans]